MKALATLGDVAWVGAAAATERSDATSAMVWVVKCMVIVKKID